MYLTVQLGLIEPQEKTIEPQAEKLFQSEKHKTLRNSSQNFGLRISFPSDDFACHKYSSLDATKVRIFMSKKNKIVEKWGKDSQYRKKDTLFNKTFTKSLYLCTRNEKLCQKLNKLSI